jgi:hypothetical protein
VTSIGNIFFPGEIVSGFTQQEPNPFVLFVNELLPGLDLFLKETQRKQDGTKANGTCLIYKRRIISSSWKGSQLQKSYLKTNNRGLL